MAQATHCKPTLEPCDDESLDVESTANRPQAFGAPITVVAVFLAAVGPARGQLVINPTFQSSITSDPNAATIEAGINAMIARLEAAISNSITVNITYGETNSGLGESSTAIGNVSYSAYRSALASQAKPSANDVSALASLPLGSSNPVNGNANVTLTAPLLRTLGFGGNVATDSTIMLNTSIMNLSRTGPQNSGFYDLQAVAGHETDEARSWRTGFSAAHDQWRSRHT